MNTKGEQQCHKAYIEAYASSDYGDGPTFAKVLVTPELLDKLRKLSGLCVEHGLSELRVYDSPELWGPGEIESELRLICGELVVTKSSFWFVDQPKNAEYHIETRAQEIEDFFKAIADDTSGVALYFGVDEHTVEEAVIETELETEE